MVPACGPLCISRACVSGPSGLLPFQHPAGYLGAHIKLCGYAVSRYTYRDCIDEGHIAASVLHTLRPDTPNLEVLDGRLPWLSSHLSKVVGLKLIELMRTDSATCSHTSRLVKHTTSTISLGLQPIKARGRALCPKILGQFAQIYVTNDVANRAVANKMYNAAQSATWIAHMNLPRYLCHEQLSTCSSVIAELGLLANSLASCINHNRS